MATNGTTALEAACKSGIDILDELMGTNIEERSRFEGKALSPSFLVGFLLFTLCVNPDDTKDPRSRAAETPFPGRKGMGTTVDYYVIQLLICIDNCM